MTRLVLSRVIKCFCVRYCVGVGVDVLECMHNNVEARDQCQMSSLVMFYLIF